MCFTFEGARLEMARGHIVGLNILHHYRPDDAELEERIFFDVLAEYAHNVEWVRFGEGLLSLARYRELGAALAASRAARRRPATLMFRHEDAAAMHAIVDALRDVAPFVERVDFECNTLPSDAALAHVLRDAAWLRCCTQLDFYWTNFSHESARALVRALPSLVALDYLSLSAICARLTDDEVAALFTALCSYRNAPEVDALAGVIGRVAHATLTHYLRAPALGALNIIINDTPRNEASLRALMRHNPPIDLFYTRVGNRECQRVDGALVLVEQDAAVEL